MNYKDKYIRFDWAIKRLLRNKANFGVLEGLLTVLLGKNIHILDILERTSRTLMINSIGWISKLVMTRTRLS